MRIRVRFSKLGKVRFTSHRDVAAAVARVVATDALPLARERKGELRVDDLRPGIESLTVDSTGANPTMRAVLTTRPRGMRPAELLAVCFPDAARPGDLAGRVLRTQQWIERDGARRELLPLADAGAPHTRNVVCA